MATQVTLNSGSVDSAGSLALKTNGTTTAVTINASQGVEFNAGAVGTPSITTTGDTNTGIFFPAADTIAFSEGGVEAMRITSTGDVGIGTSSPNIFSRPSPTTLALSGSANAYIQINGATGNNAEIDLGINSVRQASIYTDATAFGLVANTNIPMTFYTNGTERARITSGGNLLVGTTTARGIISSDFSGSANNGITLNDTASATGTNFCAFYNNASLIGSIQRVGATSAVIYNTTSDQRLKSNIEDASPVLAKLMNVKVRQFDWTDGDLHQEAGFIAQELAPVLSGIVTEGKTEEDMWQLDYSRLTPYLVKAIQEQQAIITQLQADVAALKGTA